MADPDTPDDPFLERRLATLAVLPVPARPSVDELAARPVGDEPDAAPTRPARAQQQSHRVWLLVGAAAAVVLVLVSIAALVRPNDEDGGVASGGLAASLMGREFWSATVVAGQAPGAEPVGDAPDAIPPVIVRFIADAPRLNASAGCNSFTYRYEIVGDRLVVGELGRTEIGCFGPAATTDAWLTDLLTSSPTVVLDGDRLTLTSGATAIELLDRSVAEPDLPLVGTEWMLTTVVQGEVVLSEHVAGGSIRFAARPDPSTLDYTGNDGCNDFRGSVRRTGDELDMVEWSSDEIDCPGADHHDSFFEVMRPGATLTVDGSTLTIANGDRRLDFEGAEVTVGPPPTTATDDQPPVSAAEPVPSTTSPPSQVLTGTDAVAAVVGPKWVLDATVVDGARVDIDPDRPEAYLRFEVDPERFVLTIDGNDGCNDFGGDAVVLDATISVGGFGFTERGCYLDEPPARDVADVIHRMVVGEMTYETDGSTLTISRGADTLVLRATERPIVEQPLVVPARWSTYVVAADDRTVTLTIPCTYTKAEVVDHVETEGLLVTAYVRVPADPAGRAPCAEGWESRISFTFPDAVAGRELLQVLTPISLPGS